MESFERFAGFLPEAALLETERRDAMAFDGPGGADPLVPMLPGGPWVDAIPPVGSHHASQTTFTASNVFSGSSDALTDVFRRVRHLFVRA